MLRKRVLRKSAKRSRFFQLASKVRIEMLEPRLMLSVTNPSPLPPLTSQPTPLQGVVGTPNSLDPQLIDEAYGFNTLAYNVGGTIFPANGAGQTIAIVDAYGSPTIINDAQVFDAETYTVPGQSVWRGRDWNNQLRRGREFLPDRSEIGADRGDGNG